MKKCKKCTIKLTKTNCFYLYTLFRKDKSIKSSDKDDILICDKCYDIIEDEETRIFSLLTRLNYNYKSKYYFTASLRRDASSNFTRANRVGYFPSAAVSWNAHKEDFLKDLDIFSQLKFKFGYGRTGNDRIPSIVVFDVLTDLNASYFFNGQTVQGQRTTEFGSNPNLFWETTDGGGRFLKKNFERVYDSCDMRLV